MKHSIRTYVRLALLLASLAVMGQGGPCGPPPDDGGGNGGTQDGTSETAPTTVGGSLDVVNLNVPSGQTTTATSDVVINASGNVTIDGLLTAATATGAGASITIIAQGDINIAGMVQAGNGAFATATTPAAAIARAGIATNGESADGYHGGTVIIPIATASIRPPFPVMPRLCQAGACPSLSSQLRLRLHQGGQFSRIRSSPKYKISANTMGSSSRSSSKYSSRTRV